MSRNDIYFTTCRLNINKGNTKSIVVFKSDILDHNFVIQNNTK
jgi:hypothetical protein